MKNTNRNTITAYMIVAKIPTHHTLMALGAFNLTVRQDRGGAYIGSSLFFTREDAINHLLSRAMMMFEDDKELQEAIKEAECGSLTYDNVTALINELELL